MKESFSLKSEKDRKKGRFGKIAAAALAAGTFVNADTAGAGEKLAHNQAALEQSESGKRIEAFNHPLILRQEHDYQQTLRRYSENLRSGSFAEAAHILLRRQPQLSESVRQEVINEANKFIERYSYFAVWIPTKDGSRTLHLVPPGKKWDRYRALSAKLFKQYSNAFFITPTTLLVADHAFGKLPKPVGDDAAALPTDLGIVQVRPDQQAPWDAVVPVDFSLTETDLAGRFAVVGGYDPDRTAQKDGSKVQMGYLSPIGPALQRGYTTGNRQKHVSHSMGLRLDPAQGHVAFDSIITRYAYQKIEPIRGISSSWVLTRSPKTNTITLAGVFWGVSGINIGGRPESLGFVHTIPEIKKMLDDPSRLRVVPALIPDDADTSDLEEQAVKISSWQSEVHVETETAADLEQKKSSPREQPEWAKRAFEPK